MSLRRRPGLVLRALRAFTAAAAWSVHSVLHGGSNNSDYDALDPRRKFIDRLSMQSKKQANEVIAGGLRQLQGYCRKLERNNPTARGAIEGLTALVVGTGIGIRPDTGDDDLNERVYERFMAWWSQCQVDGSDGWSLQNRTFREVVPAGEALWRYVLDQDAARRGEIPLRILQLESEWIADVVPEAPPAGYTRAMGMDVDALGRMTRLYLQNPASHSTADIFAVDADQVNLIFEPRRALQNRGEPWFSPVLETLIMERKLVDAELYAAEQTAGLAIAITSDYHDPLDDGTLADDSPYAVAGATDEDPVHKLRIGSVARMFPGEKVEALAHSRPSQQIAPFRKMLHGDLAAALRIPVRFLDRDISGANYSSMRSDMLDCQRLLGPVREWYGHASIGRAYRKVLPWILLSLGETRQVRAAYELLPDEQPYVDPLKDAQAALIAIHGGLDTYESAIAARGGDYRKVWEQRKKENGESAGVEIQTPKQISGQDQPQPANGQGAQDAA